MLRINKNASPFLLTSPPLVSYFVVSLVSLPKWVAGACIPALDVENQQVELSCFFFIFSLRNCTQRSTCTFFCPYKAESFPVLLLSSSSALLCPHHATELHEWAAASYQVSSLLNMNVSVLYQVPYIMRKWWTWESLVIEKILNNWDRSSSTKHAKWV